MLGLGGRPGAATRPHMTCSGCPRYLGRSQGRVGQGAGHRVERAHQAARTARLRTCGCRWRVPGALQAPSPPQHGPAASCTATVVPLGAATARPAAHRPPLQHAGVPTLLVVAPAAPSAHCIVRQQRQPRAMRSARAQPCSISGERMVVERCPAFEGRGRAASLTHGGPPPPGRPPPSPPPSC